MTFKEMREKAGLSQRQLAEKLGVSHSTIGSWENGLKEPSAGRFIATAQILEVDPMALAVALNLDICSR